MNKRLACNYAVIRFLPYPETQEFVNVGVVLMCPQLRCFDYRIETRRRDRVTGFFPELNPTVFIQGRRDFEQELRRLKKMLNAAQEAKQMEFGVAQDDFLALFTEIVRPRESIFRFGHIGTVLAEDPTAEITRLFGHYVERQFAQHEDFQEKIMTRRLLETFKANQVTMFKPDRLGGDDYHVTMPFVRHMGTEATDVRAIKPLDFAKDDTTRILDHGDHWVARMKRLQAQHYQPEAFLFPVRLPAQEKRTRKAAENACAELRDLGANILLFGETDRIIAFAQSA